MFRYPFSGIVVDLKLLENLGDSKSKIPEYFSIFSFPAGSEAFIHIVQGPCSNSVPSDGSITIFREFFFSSGTFQSSSLGSVLPFTKA